MTNKGAIRVAGLGKAYRLGQRARYFTLREGLTQVARFPLRLLRQWGRVAAPAEMLWALRDVSFEVKPGEVWGIIGRNGAGKSTLLKILSCITEPTAGQAEVHGRIGSLLEVGTGFHPELTGRENVYLNGAILGMRRAEIERKFEAIVSFAEVETFLDTPVKHFSSGMYMRLAFAVAAHLEPDILVIDEVLAVGDAEFQRKCLGKMGEVAQQGRTVLFVSHNMAAVKQLCGRALLLERGRVAQIGSVNEVISGYLQSCLRNDVDFDTGPLRQVKLQQSGVGLEISATYDFDRPVSLPNFGFVISDEMGAPICGSNPTIDGISRLPARTTRGEIRVQLTSPTLLPGTYRLSAWLGDGQEDLAAKIDCLRFDVASTGGVKILPRSAVGHVAPTCRWQFATAEGVTHNIPPTTDGTVN
jgi:lipopolysaccharide transport system ATP-binding protein